MMLIVVYKHNMYNMKPEFTLWLIPDEYVFQKQENKTKSFGIDQNIHSFLFEIPNYSDVIKCMATMKF